MFRFGRFAGKIDPDVVCRIWIDGGLPVDLECIFTVKKQDRVIVCDQVTSFIRGFIDGADAERLDEIFVFRILVGPGPVFPERDLLKGIRILRCFLPAGGPEKETDRKKKGESAFRDVFKSAGHDVEGSSGCH